MIKELHRMKNEIEELNVMHQKEILKILMKNKCEMSENSNGTFIVMNNLDENTIRGISEYLQHVRFQNSSLQEIENKKEHLLAKYFKPESKIK